MHAAAQALVGEHDFSAFRAVECQAKSPLRRVERLDVTRNAEWLTLAITANAFLHHMVRNVAGLLLSVGHGESPPERVVTVLASRDRKTNAATAPPDGLYLSAVRYPPGFGLPGAVAGNLSQSAIIGRTFE
jgi:tRNA pseudouridine38-40 synthase